MESIVSRVKGIFLFRYPVVEIFTGVMSFYLHLKYSFKHNSPLEDKDSFVAYLIKTSHIVEKGLSLPNPRPFFGKEKIDKLLYFTNIYIEKFGFDELVGNINSALIAYVDYHNQFDNSDVNQTIVKIKAHLIKFEKSSKENGGVEKINDTSFSPDDTVFERYSEIVGSRRSIRDFDTRNVSLELIYKAIQLSLNTPSACNRQGWNVSVFTEKKDIKDLLTYQNGNAGFGTTIRCLLVVTGCAKAFTRFEHNQLYIDAGMFSMNIINSLHALGLGTCALNLCMPYSQENKLKKVAGIDKSERLVMMIAVGHKKDTYFVAKSPRKKIESVLRVK